LKFKIGFFPLPTVIVAGTESNSISVAWDYSCPYKRTLFKVYITHLEFKACPTKEKDEAVVRNKELYDVRSALIDGLHSFSNYKVSFPLEFYECFTYQPAFICRFLSKLYQKKANQLVIST